MKKEKKKVLLLTAIILSLTVVMLPVSADCEIGRLSADDVDYQVEGISETPYAPGEQISLTYHIYPSDSSSSELDGDCGISRYYDVYTILEKSNLSATLLYAAGEKETHPVSSDIYEQFGNGVHLSFSVPDSNGVEEIRIEVSGHLPSTYSDKLTVLSLDVSHADRGVLPPVQLVGAENFEGSTKNADERISETENSETRQSSLPHQQSSAQIGNLNLSIDPSYVEARPGDTVNYSVTINWTPADWRGDLRFCGTLSAAGFHKSFDFKSKPSDSPPIENEIPVTLPQNVPPLNYSVNLTVTAGSQKANDETTLKVNSSTTAITPGFETAMAVTGLVAGLFIIKKRR